MHSFYKYLIYERREENKMVFNYSFGMQKVKDENIKVNHREAIRGIILKDNKFLMIHSNKGDYKFPGGGMNENESHEDAVKREVREETGHIISSVKFKLGEITQRNVDTQEKDSVFEMVSHYYMCEITGEQTQQELDDYEAELEFCPVWISLEEAISLNEEILKKGSKDKNPWVRRETTVLKALREAQEIWT